jgi:hypothetical protein
MRLEEEQGTEGKPKADGDMRFLYRATAEEWGVWLWRCHHASRVGGGAQCGCRRRRSGGKGLRPAGAGGRWRRRVTRARAHSNRGEQG